MRWKIQIPNTLDLISSISLIYVLEDSFTVNMIERAGTAKIYIGPVGLSILLPENPSRVTIRHLSVIDRHTKPLHFHPLISSCYGSGEPV